MTCQGIKPGHGVKPRVKAFFAANPGEELTYADLMAKFDCNEKNAQRVVQELKKEGFIESIHILRTPAKGRA